MSNWQAYKRLQETMLRRNAADTQSAMSRFRADEQEATALSPTSGLYNEAGTAMARDTQALETNRPLSTPRPPVNNSRYRYTGMPPSPMSASVDGSRLLENISAGGGGDGTTMPQRPRRPAAPMQSRLMGSAGGGGLNQFYQNQRRGYATAPTPRQRFTA